MRFRDAAHALTHHSAQIGTLAAPFPLAPPHASPLTQCVRHARRHYTEDGGYMVGGPASTAPSMEQLSQDEVNAAYYPTAQLVHASGAVLFYAYCYPYMLAANMFVYKGPYTTPPVPDDDPGYWQEVWNMVSLFALKDSEGNKYAFYFVDQPWDGA